MIYDSFKSSSFLCYLLLTFFPLWMNELPNVDCFMLLIVEKNFSLQRKNFKTQSTKYSEGIKYQV